MKNNTTEKRHPVTEIKGFDSINNWTQMRKYLRIMTILVF